DVCIPDVNQINATFPLHNDWMIYYIQTQDTTIFPPCEGVSNIDFDTKHHIMEGTISLNWFNGSYTEIDETTIQMPETFSLSLGLGTYTQAYFEKKFLQVLAPDAAIRYSLENNFLLLENKSRHSLIMLYLKP